MRNHLPCVVIAMYMAMALPHYMALTPPASHRRLPVPYGQNVTGGGVMRGAEAVIRALEQEGVKYITGFSGGGLAPLWEPLRASSIQVFSARHERLGVEIADGYARAT